MSSVSNSLFRKQIPCRILWHMDIRSRLYGPCGEFFREPERVVLDRAALIRRLILFDTYILKSVRLLEIHDLVELFGYTGLRTLLESGALKIQCGLLVMGKHHEPQPKLMSISPESGVCFESFSIDILRAAQPQVYLRDALHHVHQVPGLTVKQAFKLKHRIAGSLMEIPEKAGQKALKNTIYDVQVPQTLKILVASTIRRIRGDGPNPEQIEVSIHRDDESEWHFSSNLSALLGISQADVDETIGLAVLASASLNLRFEEMEMFSALSGVLGAELPEAQYKLSLIERTMAPQKREDELQRVLDIGGLPDLPGTCRVDVDKLLRLRESPECATFRAWLQRTSDMPDEEVRDLISGIASRLGALGATIPGKAIRFLTTTAVCGIPVLGTVAGAMMGLLDQFLFDRLISKSGPALFVHHLYPSIYENANLDK